MQITTNPPAVRLQSSMPLNFHRWRTPFSHVNLRNGSSLRGSVHKANRTSLTWPLFLHDGDARRDTAGEANGQNPRNSQTLLRVTTRSRAM
jgi:hypothetical protein